MESLTTLNKGGNMEEIYRAFFEQVRAKTEGKQLRPAADVIQEIKELTEFVVRLRSKEVK